MKRVSVWNIAGVTLLPDGSHRVDYLSDGASRAACEADAHAAFPFGIRICPGCYPSTYPTTARHRKDEA